MKKLILFNFAIFLTLLVSAPTSASGNTISKQEMEPVFNKASEYKSGSDATSIRLIESWVRQSISNHQLRSTIEPMLINLLVKSKEPDAIIFAATQLAIIGSDKSLNAVSLLLTNASTVTYGTLALSGLDSTNIGKLLVNALENADEKAKVQIINHLGNLHYQPSLKYISKYTSSTNQDIAVSAIISIGKLASKSGTDLLFKLLDTNNITIRNAAAEALAIAADQFQLSKNKEKAIEIYQRLLQSNSLPIHFRRGAFAALTDLDPDYGISRILNAIRSNDAALKHIAIARIAYIKSPNASQYFAKQLNNLTPNDQIHLLNSLAIRGDASAVEAIIGSLNSSNTNVVYAAIRCLPKLGSLKSIKPLILLLDSPDATTSQLAEQALISMPNTFEADKLICDSLPSANNTTKVRLINVIAKRYIENSTPLLTQEILKGEEQVALIASKSLPKVAKTNDLPSLLGLLSVSLKSQLRQELELALYNILTAIPDTSLKEKLLTDQLSSAQTLETKSSIIKLLPTAQTTATYKSLMQYLNDPQPELSKAAQTAILEWTNTNAWDEILRLAKTSPDNQIRNTAFTALLRIIEENNQNIPEISSYYAQLLQLAGSDSQIKAILGTISSPKDPKLIELIKPMISNPQIKQEATIALQKISDSLKNSHPQAAADALKLIGK